MKIFLDDERDPPDDSWTVVRSSRQFFELIYNYGDEIKEVSFDHDLGEEEWDGLGCAKMVYMLYNPDIRTTVHSANPVGAENIQNLFSGFRCPDCGRVSHNENDIKHNGACNKFHK